MNGLEAYKHRFHDIAVLAGYSYEDIVPAKGMGMHTIWVRRGLGSYWNIQGDEEIPEAQVDCILDIRDLL